MCRADVRRGDVGAPGVWVLQPLASGGRAGFSARTDTWTRLPRLEEWRRRAGAAQVPGRPTWRGPAPPMVEARVGGEQDGPGGRKGQTPGSHRPPAKMAAANGIRGSVVRGVRPRVAVSSAAEPGLGSRKLVWGALVGWSSQGAALRTPQRVYKQGNSGIKSWEVGEPVLMTINITTDL